VSILTATFSIAIGALFVSGQSTLLPALFDGWPRPPFSTRRAPHRPDSSRRTSLDFLAAQKGM